MDALRTDPNRGILGVSPGEDTQHAPGDLLDADDDFVATAEAGTPQWLRVASYESLGVSLGAVGRQTRLRSTLRPSITDSPERLRGRSSRSGSGWPSR